MGRNAIDKKKRTRISQNGYILDKEAVRRKQLLLQSFGKGRNWGGGVCRPHFPCLIACCWFLQMLLDSSKSVIKTWLFCPIATSHWLMLKKQPTYISFIRSCCPSQKHHRKRSVSVATHHMKRMAAPQRISRSHPKAIVRTLPNWTSRTMKNVIPRTVICWVSLTHSLRVLSQPLWSGNILWKTLHWSLPGTGQDSCT